MIELLQKIETELVDAIEREHCRTSCFNVLEWVRAAMDAAHETPKTKDGTEVKVGQVWEDMDKRMGGRQRRIYAIEGDKVVMGRVDRDTGVKTKVSISRLRPVSGGWKLVG